MAQIQDRVLAGRIETLIGQQPMAVLANLVNSGLSALVLSPLWPASGLILWVGAIWTVSALRVAVWLSCRRGFADPADVVGVGRLQVALAAASGLLWGIPGALIFSSGPIVLQGFIVFVLGGMSAGAVSTSASHLPAFFAYLVPSLLPIVLSLLFEGGMLYFSMGLMGAVYFAVLVTAGINLNRTLSRQLQLQIEKSDLADRLTAARIEAETANRAKSAFLATVSHELRTPLNAVLGFTQAIEQQVHGPLGNTAYEEYIQHIQGSGTHLLALINELLDFSKAEQGRLEIVDERVDLTAAFKDCIALIAPRAKHHDIKLQTTIERPMPALRADPRRLKQIILNVLSNAVKFTPNGGRIDISAEHSSSGEIIVSVRDTGIGMAEDDMAIAMEHFGQADSSHSRTTGGTGIGLPFTALLMQLHGGEVIIDSRPGEGTLVRLHFPAERVIEGSVSSLGTDAASSRARESA